MHYSDEDGLQSEMLNEGEAESRDITNLLSSEGTEMQIDGYDGDISQSHQGDHFNNGLNECEVEQSMLSIIEMIKEREMREVNQDDMLFRLLWLKYPGATGISISLNMT